MCVRKMGKYGIDYNVKYLLSILNYRLIIKILIKLYLEVQLCQQNYLLKLF